MSRRPGWFSRVLWTNFFQSVATQAMRPTISYRALSIGAGPAEIGLISSCFGLLSLIAAVPAGRGTDRLGEGPFMTGGTLVIALVAIFLVGADTIPMLVLAMLTFGVGQIVSNVATQTLIANGGDPDQRDARFGTQSVVASMGQLVGPILAGLIIAQAIGDSDVGASGAGAPASSTNGVFVAGAVAALLAMLAAASLWRSPPTEHARNATGTAPLAPESTLRAVRRVMRIPSIPQAMLASMAVLSCTDMLIVFLPVYGVANGVPVVTVGVLLAVRGLASLSARVLMMPLLRRLGRRRLLITSMIIPAAMFGLLPMAGSNFVALVAIIALIGGGLGLCQPLTMSWVATQAPVDIRGTAVGVRLSANRFAQFAIPLLGGMIAGVAGLLLIFWSLALLLAGSAALVTRAPFAPGTVDIRSSLKDGSGGG